ncbi:MAG TPA: protein kinase [Stellaceae bacterium]|jgi:serine/threonine protein kinase
MPDPDSPSPAPEDGQEATRLFATRGAAKSTVLQSGTVLGNTYVIGALLGRGGMGEVYRATHVELGTEHAIKIMLPSLADDPKIVQLFREEARKLGRVNNDAIVNYEGFFRDEHGLRYLVTEFVHGESLQQVLHRRRLEPEEVLRLRDRLASGLAAAHEIDIVHRDVSPENVLLPEGRVDRAKLIDFGIAKAMGPKAISSANATVLGGEFAGKYSYVSPEQIGLFGGRVDLRSDIYSLGLVLAAAAIGFGRKLDMGSSAATMIAARQRVPDLSEVPAPLRPVIAPMLAPRPDDRPPSMRALPGGVGDRLRASVSGLGAVPVESSRRRAFLALAAAAGLIALIVAALAMLRVLRPPPSTDELRASLAAATAGYHCASLDYTLGPDRSARVSGYAATPGDIARLRHAVDGIGGITKVDFAVGLRVWPYCQALAILQPLMQHQPRVAATVSLSPWGEAHLGQPLYVDARAPSFDGYIYVDYFDGEGDVLHLFPNSEDRLNFRPAQNHWVLGKPPLARCWILGGRTGEQLITLIATAEPLFPDRRPEAENARDYLPALSQAIADLPRGRSTAVTDFFQLGAAPPLASRVDGCRS